MTARVSARTLIVVRLRRVRSLIAVVALALAGCPRSAPASPDGGGDEIDVVSPVLDTDRDGLCDGQEISRGLRIDDPDSDADGFSDLAEVSLGADPLLPASPEREQVILLEEVVGATARATATALVRGMGETYRGTFTPVRQIFDDGVADAGTFLLEARAVGADPMANVFRIEGQTFEGVRGRTALVFEVLFRFTGEPRGCIRAYPFQYIVRRDDGRTVLASRFTLVVAPRGSRPGAGSWCTFDPCF